LFIFRLGRLVREKRERLSQIEGVAEEKQIAPIEIRVDQAAADLLHGRRRRRRRNRRLRSFGFFLSKETGYRDGKNDGEDETLHFGRGQLLQKSARCRRKVLSSEFQVPSSKFRVPSSKFRVPSSEFG